MACSTTADVEKEYRALLFGVRRSVRYHNRRRRFFEGRNRFTNALSVILGSTVVATTLANLTENCLLIIISSFVAVAAIVDLIGATIVMARLHADLARKFIELEQQLVLMKEPTEDELREARAVRLRIEADEPPVYRVLDILCHNEMVLAGGHGEGELYAVPLYKSVVAHLIPFGDASIKKQTATSTKKN